MNLDEAKPSKEVQLVNALVKTTGVTQQQLVRELYGSTGSANAVAFRKLRSRVQTKLLNHLFFLDHSDPRHIVTRRYEMQVLGLFHQVSALYAEGEYVLSARLLRKCLRLAEEGEFTWYSLQAARTLRAIYADQGQAASYRAIEKKLAKLQQQLGWEEEVERLNAEVKLLFVSTVASRRANMAKLPAYIKQIEDLHRRARSYNTFFPLYRLRLAQEEAVGNYSEIINITTDAARRLQQGKLNERRFDKRFNNFMSVYAHLRGGQAVRGLKLAEVYARDFHHSSTNWFYFHEHYLLLALHAGQYERAQRILQTVSKNQSYPKQRPAAQQRWELFRAYVEFLQPTPAAPLKARSIAQWALMIPEYNRDKRGHNVAILVLQMLYYLRQRDLDAVLVRMERLRKYQQRHLREAATLRSRLFLRLLALVVEKDFDADECAEKGQNILAKLRAAPQPGEAYAQIEIIPYENLWAITLQLLRNGPRMAARQQA
ncbi:hypothetical protein [Hymenobacter saemangeumensis]|uniref:hypothetical protein n=1 Tax=Hymenobacter saemangeumensis TaxID=1084522 RepID=UPI0031F08797